MNYFGEDGPEPMAQQQPSADEMKAVAEMSERSKEKYLKFFMVDFIEMSMRKVSANNTIFCANQAKLFDNLMDEDLTTRQKKQQMDSFENCLGKHTDSFDYALVMMMEHLQGNSIQKTTYQHDGEVNTIPGRTNKPTYEIEDRGDQYLLSQNLGSDEPVYDSPKPK